MKSFLFTADWHIKSKLKDVPAHWLYTRLTEFFEWLEKTRVDTGAEALVIGGDIFDSVPSIFELSQFSRLFSMTNFSEYVFYPGNHEMQNKKKSFYQDFHTIFASPNRVFVYEDMAMWNDWLIIPYPLIKHITVISNKLVMSHVRCASDKGLYDAEIDFSIFNSCKTVLLGDIHVARLVYSNIWYPGSPYDTSFGRIPLPNHGIIFVDPNGICTQIDRPMPYKRLIHMECTLEKYEQVKNKIKNSDNIFEVIVSTTGDTAIISDDPRVRFKPVLNESDLPDISGNIEEDMHKYLVEYIKLTPDRATSVLSKYKEYAGGIYES